MKSRINLKFFLIICLLSFSIVKGQNSGIEILRKVMENTLNLENALYNFTINSKNKNDLFPTNGRLYVEGKKYFIDTEGIDQIYDGSMLYTIIHENKEIIVTSESNTFFNFSPVQLFNFFKDDFDIDIDNGNNKSIIVSAISKFQDDIIYKIIIDSNMLSIKQIDLLNRDNLVLTTFLTLSYNFNIPLTGSLFKFDKEKFKDYILIED